MDYQIVVQESGGRNIFLPLTDIEEHKNYFCWSHEEAILTRIYYQEYKTLPTGDMIFYAIMEYLGIKREEGIGPPSFELTLKWKNGAPW